MKKRTVALAGLLLAACGVTPQRPAEESHYSKSARTPYAAAICIARNARSGSDGLQADEKTLGTASWEVVVRSRDAVLAVAEAHDDGVGAAIVIRVTPSVQSGRGEFAQRLAAGC